MAPSAELRKKVGQLFAVGFHGLTPDTGIRTLIRDYDLGAVILFKRNIKDADQLKALTRDLQQEAKDAGHEFPLFIGIDQENGLVTRVCPPIAAQQPGQMALGATGSSKYAYEVGKATGEVLDFFGINMNYAPDCDINSEPLNPVIGVRSPGDNPEFVANITSATAQGLRERGVVPTVKHFPGHGDTAVDSHVGLPVITKTRSELEKCELVPFRRAVAEGIEAVMTAHIALPEIGQEGLPATLSSDALNMLRKDMKYDGVIITDCLEMDGIRATYGTVEGALMSLKAGSDSVMICHTYEVQVRAIDRVCEAVESGDLPTSQIDDSLRRVTALKKRFVTWERALETSTTVYDLARLNGAHQDLAKDVYSHSVTVVRDESNLLPISASSNVLFLSPGGRIPAGGAVDESGPKHKTFLNVLEAHCLKVTEIKYSETSLSGEEWELVKEADVVILATRNAREAEEQLNLGFELAKRKDNLIVIATCNPYDFLDDIDIKTYLATYEPTVEAFSAAVEVIFGQASAKGSLPVEYNIKRTKKSGDDIQISPYGGDNDIEGINLQAVINKPNGHHFLAREDDIIIGLCLAYKSLNRGVYSAQIAVLAVESSKQGQGTGSRLLSEAREYFREQHGLQNVTLGSYFPRFWPIFPTDLPPTTQEFFIHRGLRLDSSDDTNADLYQDIRLFIPPQKYLDSCVGVDDAYRDKGVGLAVLCHAIENMKGRGIETVFIDGTNKVDWYAKLGFLKWKEYRKGEI